MFVNEEGRWCLCVGYLNRIARFLRLEFVV